MVIPCLPTALQSPLSLCFSLHSDIMHPFMIWNLLSFHFNIFVEIKRNLVFMFLTLHLKLPSIWKPICQLGRDSFLKKHWGNFPGHADFQKSIILYHGIPSCMYILIFQKYKIMPMLCTSLIKIFWTIPTS